MRKYQASKRILLGTALVGFFLQKYALRSLLMPAISGNTLQQLCGPEFIQGNNILGSNGVNGMGGIGNAFRMGAPTLCIKGAKEQLEAAAHNARISPIVKNISRTQAIMGLARLGDTDCTQAKVGIKSQMCFLYKILKKKAKSPIVSIITSGNALVLKHKDKVTAMVVIEKFGSLRPKKKKAKTIEQLIGKPSYHATFNEFDDPLKREGTINPRSKINKCTECLKHLRNESVLGGEVDCNACDTSIVLPFDFESTLKS